MPMMDYVIGGMDRSFKTKLFHTLRAAELAGMSPGITSAFRDDYRQSIASGLKAATGKSYHGGSSFGSNTLGITGYYYSSGRMTEANTVLSTHWTWDSYRGALRSAIDLLEPPAVASRLQGGSKVSLSA